MKWILTVYNLNNQVVTHLVVHQDNKTRYYRDAKTKADAYVAELSESYWIAYNETKYCENISFGMTYYEVN